MTDKIDISDKAASEFFFLVKSKVDKLTKTEEHNKKIVADKNHILIPIRKLLKKLVESGVYVENYASYDFNAKIRHYAPQELKVWENESSPHWQPGNSIYLDHPAMIEIAVTNMNQREKEGLISISCTTYHPNSNLLRGPFRDVEQACMALIKFLGESVVRIERPEYK